MLIALPFGLIYMNITPPLWGTDETSHFARVYQLAHGQILPHMDQANYGGSIPKNLYDLSNYTKDDLLDNKVENIPQRKDVDNISAYKRFTDKSFSKEQHAYIWTASYSPVAYIGPTIGVVVADIFNTSIGQTIFLARLGSLLVYVALIWLSIRLLRDSKLKWLIFVIALLPISLFQASVVTADSIATGLSLLFISLFIRLIQDKKLNTKNRTILNVFIGVALILPLAKINYIFLSLALILLPTTLFRTNKAAIAIKAAVTTFAIMLGLIWTSVINVSGNAPVSQRPDGIKVIPAAQISFVMHQPLHFIAACVISIVKGMDSYIQSITALIGWNYISIPLVFIFALCLSIIFSAMYAKDELIVIRKKLLLLCILALGGIISIFGALYVAFNPPGSRIVDGVQGRYFLPFLVPIVITIASYIPVEVKIKDKMAPYLFGVISITCLTVSVIYYSLATY